MTDPRGPWQGPYQPQWQPSGLQQTSGAAVASLVLGIIGLFASWVMLGIPSLLAVILGHVGVSATRLGHRSGRGMAIAGLVLGYVVAIPSIWVAIVFLSALGSTSTGH